jgi:hypothetical protein
MRKIVKSYYISDDGTVTSKGNNEK